MSNNLISRSVLLEEINNFSMRIPGSVNAMAITIMEETKKSIAKMIDEQPTAYDVNKVVEKLEEHFNATDDSTARLAYHHAIEIVKSSGIE